MFGFGEELKSGLIRSEIILADDLALLAASAHVARGSVSLLEFADVVVDVAVVAAWRFDFGLELRREDPVVDARSESFSWRSS